MNQEEMNLFFNGLSDVQKKEIEEVFQRKRTELFQWHQRESEKVLKKLKDEGRFQSGLDANIGNPEMKEISAEYHRRFHALPEECVQEIMEQSAYRMFKG